VYKSSLVDESNASYSVLIPDGDSSLLGSVAKCLFQVKNVRLFIMSGRKDNPFRYSRYIHRFLFFPDPHNPLEWIATIDKVVAQYRIDVIMPIWETGIKSILEHQAQLKNRKKLVPLPTLQNFNIAISKDLLAAHMQRFAVPGPKTVPLSFDLLEDSGKFNLHFPLLAKPLKSGGGRGIVKFRDFESLSSHFKTKGIHQPYILQEFVQGVEYGCNVFCREGEILAFTIQKGNLWDPSKPYSYQIGLDFIYNEKLYQTVKSLMKSLQWNGIADLDLIHDEKTDTFHIIEINPRFWGTTLGALMAGINYPYLWVLLAKKMEIPPQSYKHMPYVNMRGLKLLIKNDKSILLKPKFIWNNSPIRFKFYDPARVFLQLLLKTKGMIKAKWRFLY
jgi:predicted ATP-grasp superfamily ATP-dependent carboligase